jgi:hypothetical protein
MSCTATWEGSVAHDGLTRLSRFRVEAVTRKCADPLVIDELQ